MHVQEETSPSWAGCLGDWWWWWWWWRQRQGVGGGCQPGDLEEIGGDVIILRLTKICEIVPLVGLGYYGPC